MSETAFLMVGSPEKAVNLSQVKTAKMDQQGVANLTMVGEGADMFISFRLVAQTPSSYALARALAQAIATGGVWRVDEFQMVYQSFAAEER